MTTIGVGTGAGDGGEPVSDAGDPGSGGTSATAGKGGSSFGAAPPTFSGGPSVGGGSNESAGAAGESSEPSNFSGEPLGAVSKLDLLLVVDNSIDTQQKQEMFRRSVGKLLGRLTGEQGIQDIQVGVISTSLGARGGQVCNQPEADDRAHLIPTMRTGVTSWNRSGFAKWDPAGAASPPGHADAATFAAEVDEVLAAVGTTGCGFEASLESWYRFLVDPEPYASVAERGQATGIDDVLLAQRAKFLRPDSALAIVLMTDENDCSIMTEGQGWLIGTQSLNGQTFRMPPSTSACATDPLDECCTSCASAPPVGCMPFEMDPACSDRALPAEEDSLNLRCWDQKRRFGVDLLYPLQRYVDGLSKPGVGKRYSAELAANPLFSPSGGKSRRPGHVLFAAVLGVPWQDVADEGSLTGPGLELLSAQQLAAQGRWPLMLSNGTSGAPNDPFMVESNEQRSGTHPLTGDTIESVSSGGFNRINGHEHGHLDDLQNACSFAVEPLDCKDGACVVCSATLPQSYLEGIYECQAPDGSYGPVQYNSGATPGTRPLEVLRRIGSSAIVGSACPKILDSEDPDGDYMPTMDALFDRVTDLVR